VYAKGLSAELKKSGVENVIAAPAAGRSEIADGISDQGNGVRLRRFRCSERPGDLGEIYGEGDPVAAESFKKVLDEEKPDIVHLHAWSPAVSILLVREVKRRGIRIIQTYHTPTLSCPRGTLMRWGRVVCDGDLAKRPCALCCIEGKVQSLWGNKKWIEDRGERIEGGGEIRIRKVESASIPDPLSAIPKVRGGFIQNTVSKLTTMLRMPGLIRKRTEAVRELLRSADKMVALNHWTKELLKVNGVEEGKIEVIRHGVPAQSAGGIGPLRPAHAHPSHLLRNLKEGRLRGGIGDRVDRIEEADISSRKDAKDAEGIGDDKRGALKLVFLGRVAPEKGIDVLLRAMEIVKIPVELDVYGIRSDAGYGIRDSGGGEKPECKNPKARIRWLEPVKPEAVVETIRKYDALVVPSVWLETGPLVVLEAFAAGVPVIGSRLGGIAEMLRDGVDGLLFEAGNPKDLAGALEKISEQLEVLRKGVKKPAGLRDLATQHKQIYAKIIISKK
jgi:glycosyltransferase involved in cell wall biosynthesis